MQPKAYKYIKFLEQYVNCPPHEYVHKEGVFFRWVSENNTSGSFIPLNQIKDPPPRMLDDSDKMCKGYGLSFFNSLENADKAYKKAYKRKRTQSHDDFIREKGDAIASIQVDCNKGVCGNLNEKNGHFTFHEYAGTDLSKNIVNTTEIFDENGNFTR